jgi:hypothetical protein
LIAVFAIQSDPVLVQQFERLVSIQLVGAVALSIISLAVLGVAIASLFAIRKLIAQIDRTLGQVVPRFDPLLTSVTRIADDAEDVSSELKHRVKNLMKTVDELNERVLTVVDDVEYRVRKFGTVADVVQAEAEEILLDAASTARGVHTASQVLRSGRVAPMPELVDDDDDYTE